MYIPQYFALHELLPLDFYNQFYPHRGDSLWTLFDPSLLMAMDALRIEYGPMVANDWQWGGKNNYRGYRPADCTVGAMFSQHKFGRAVDLIPTQTTAELIRHDLLGGRYTQKDIGFVTAIELDVSWLHIDVRNHDAEKYGIKTFRPV